MKKIYGAIMAAVVSLTIVAVAQAQTVFNVDPVKGAQVLQLILAGNFASQAAATDSSLTITGSRFASFIVTTSTSIAALPGNAYRTSGASVTFTLPLSSSCLGQEIYVHNAHGSSTNVAVTPTGSDDINGANSVVDVTNGNSSTFVASASGWFAL